MKGVENIKLREGGKHFSVKSTMWAEKRQAKQASQNHALKTVSNGSEVVPMQIMTEDFEIPVMV